MQIAALAGIVFAALWLVWVGGLMMLRPASALSLLRRTAGDTKASAIEQIPRMVAGAALIVRAPAAKLPAVFELGGWFIVVSSAVLLIVPLRWHSGYALWWADRIASPVVRAIGALSVGLAGALVYAAV